MNFLSHRPSIPVHPAGAAFHSPGHGAAGLNLNAHMPRELSAATQGLNPSEFRADFAQLQRAFDP